MTASANPTSSCILEAMTFDNRFTRELPADPQTKNFLRQVRRGCFSRALPTSVARLRLVAYAREVADLLDLGIDPFESDDFADVFFRESPAGRHGLVRHVLRR